MNGYNFTERVRKVLALAREEAARLGHEFVGTEHELLGIIREGEGLAATVLQNLGVDLDALRQTIDDSVKRGKSGTVTGPDLPYTSRAKKVLEFAMSEARELNHSYVGTEHLLLGLLRERSGIAGQVLVDAGVTIDTARVEVLRILGDDTVVPAASTEGGDPVRFGSGAHRVARRTGSPTVALPQPLRSIADSALEIARAAGRPSPDVGDVLQAVVFSSRVVAATFASREIDFQGMLMEIRSLLEHEPDPPPD